MINASSKNISESEGATFIEMNTVNNIPYRVSGSFDQCGMVNECRTMNQRPRHAGRENTRYDHIRTEKITVTLHVTRPSR